MSLQFFVADDGTTGQELWVTDGSTAGTFRLRDINPGLGGANIGNLVQSNGIMYFTAYDGSAYHMWRSDGTTAGTYALTAPENGDNSGNLINVNGRLFFTGSDSVHGAGLFVTDGTTGGTQFVQTIASASQFFAVGDTLFFTANDPVNGTELWSSDGSAAGTHIVKDVMPGSGSGSYGNFTASDGKLYFTASNGANGTEVWVSDGTAAGTFQLKDINLGPDGSNASNFYSANGHVFFTANDGAHGNQLWSTDGTTGGTHVLTLGTGQSPLMRAGAQVVFSHTLYYVGTDPSGGSAIYTSDGATLTKLSHLSSFSGKFYNLGSQLMFFGNDGTHGSGLYTFDGASVAFVSSVSGGFSQPVLSNGKVFFISYDPAHGSELWVSDGTAAGTHITADINPGSYDAQIANISAVNGGVAFTAYRPDVGIELFFSDGTVGGTGLLANANPTGDHSPSLNLGSPVYQAGALGFFAANDGTNGYELWVTDGSTGGSHMVTDLVFGGNGSNPQNFFVAGNTIYFTADDGVNGRQLYTSDGTTVTRLSSSDLSQPYNDPSRFFTIGNTFYYMAYDSSANGGNFALYSSNGTAATTQRVGHFGYDTPLHVGGAMILHGDDGVHGAGLYSFGGTGVPALIANINNYENPVVSGGNLFWRSSDGGNGYELWTTNGTSTHLVTNINPGPYDSYPDHIIGLGNGRVVFTAFNPSTGNEVYVSDGTAGGTMLLQDVNATGNHNQSLNFNSYVVTAGTLTFFAGEDGIHGTELWVSDGTSTHMVTDLVVGGSSSSPQGLFSAGGKIYFTADDGVNGRQLYTSDGTTVTQLSSGDFDQPYNDASRFFTIGSTFYYMAYDSSANGGGFALFKSNGTVATTTRVGKMNFDTPLHVGTGMILHGDDGVHGSGLYSFNGTGVPTLISAIGNYENPVVSGNNLFWRSSDGGNGYELWTTNGTSAHLVTNINPGPYDSYPDHIIGLGDGRVVFTAFNPSTGNEVYVSDGTAGGTTLLKDLNATGNHNQSLNFNSNVVTAGALTFFAGEDGVHGNELWVSDGTNTHMVTDLVVGGSSSSPQGLFSAGGKIYFTADDGVNGRQLYTSDGATVTQLTTAGLDQPYNDASRFFTVGGKFYYMAYDPAGGFALYSSNGTVATTTRVGSFNYDTPLHVGSGMILHGDDGTHGSGLYSFNGSGTPTFVGASGNYENPVVSGSNVFWRGYDGTNGYELWSTNGTSVQMVKDISPGGNWSYPDQITSLGNGSVVFTADDDGTHGREIWVSNGTDAGTFMLGDLFPDATGSDPHNLIQVGSQVFFTANYFSSTDGAHGVELFVTDGTAAHTHIVRDMTPGSGSTTFGSFFAFGNKLYYAAYDPSLGWRTFVTDGTDANTHAIAPGDGSSTGAAGNFLKADATHFFFTGDSGLFYSDGTDAGTVNIGSGRGFDLATSSYANGQLLYRIYDDANGYELWSTNGTAASTHRLTDTLIPNSSNATGFVFSGGKVYFYADDGVHGANELFVTDGTTAGTHLLNDFNGAGGTSYGSNFAFGGKFYFAAYDGDNGGWHTYVTDGTTTHLIAPGDGSATGPAGNFLAADATHFFFTGDSGLFYSDGTDAGTVNIGSSRGFDLSTSSYANGQLLYRIYDDANGYELWSTNGTAASTHRLTDTLIPNSSNATGFVFSGGKVYFYADDGVHGGNELFVTDGTTASTHLLNDFNGAGGTPYGSNFAFGGKFYFTAYDGNNGGWHIYVTDGTGTPHLIAPGDASSPGGATNFITADATHFFFTGDSGLFYSDGTDAGTHLVGDTRGYGNASIVNGVLYYSHYDDTNGTELWSSDGTTAGTHRLTDTQVPNSSNPGGFSPVDNSPPTMANAGVTAITDQQTNHPFQNVVIGDSDAPAQTLTVTITPDDPAKGAFTAASLTASGFVGGGINGSYTFTGTAALATAAIDALVYQPTANRLVVGASETMNFTVAINDGAGGSVVNHQTSITQTSANDAPVGVNNAASVNEDASVSASTRAAGVLGNDTDADVGETPGLVVTGAHAGAVADTAVGASGKTTIHGTYGDLHIAADGTYDYTPSSAAAEALAVGQTGTEAFSYTVTDVHGANGTATLTFTIAGQEDGPVAVADVASVAEDFPLTVFPRSSALLANDTDVDNGEAASLRVIGAHFGSAADTAVLSSGGQTLIPGGTYGEFRVMQDGTYTYWPHTAAAEALTEGQHVTESFSYTIADAQGQTSSTTVTFDIVGQNDAPISTNDVAAAVNEDATVSVSTRAAGVLGNDSDVDTGETATLRVAGAHFGAAADTTVAASGQTVIQGLYGDLSIAANGTYSYTPNSPAAEALALGQMASDVFSYTVADVNNGIGTASLTFNITGQNDAPTATLASGTNAVEQVTYDLKGKIAIGDVDSGNPVETVTLTVGYGVLHLAAGTSGATITANDAATVSVSGTIGQLSALFGSDATSVATYYADTDTPPASVTLNVSVTDDHSATGASSATIVITPVDDPAVAMNDTNAVIADQSITAASVFGNDYDVDGPGLQVATVNGVAGNVGSQITLPSGALLTLRANGTYDYNPNHAFDSLTAITGATNHVGADSFTYGLVNGNTATVTITVTASPDSTATGYGSSGNDTMTGTAHDDLFDLRQGGSDTASGLGGNDNFYMGAAWNAADAIDGGTGADQVIAQGNTNLTLSATSLTGIEQLTLLTGSDPSYGDVFGFPYSYNITTNDANVAAGQQLAVQGGSLHANEALTFNGAAEIDGSFLVYGGLGSDVLTGGQLDDTLYGGGGNDRLNGGLGADTMYGGAGNDTFVVDNAGDVVIENAGEGTDTVESSIDYTLGANVENLTLTGTSDTIGIGNALANVITGNSGNNSLVGGSADTLIGGAGDDIYTVSDSSTVVVEVVGGGNDILKSSVSYVLGAGVDVETSRLIGTANIDLTGNADHQILIGNIANNVIDGGGGGDRMKGGAGDDTYIIRSAADVIVEIAGDGDDTVKAAVSYTLGAAAQVEHLYTLDANATTAIDLTGNDYSHEIQGNAGVNVLTGGSGDDTISGNGGADTLIGGAGDDIYAVTDASTVIVESGGGGNDTIKAFVSYTLGAGVDVETSRLIGTANIDLTGNADHQILIGNLGNNTIDGGGGGDRMKGGAGDDTYIIRSSVDVIVEIAGDGSDTVKAAVSYTLGAAAQIEHLRTIDASATTAINLTGNDYSHDIQGNAGANVLTGGTGDDVLQGFAGNDTLTGGAGADRFVFDHGTGQDSVGDFVSGSDKLDLSAFGFADFAAVQAATHDVGGNAVIDLGGGDSVTLTGFLTAQLQSGDVITSASSQMPLTPKASVQINLEVKDDGHGQIIEHVSPFWLPTGEHML